MYRWSLRGVLGCPCAPVQAVNLRAPTRSACSPASPTHTASCASAARSRSIAYLSRHCRTIFQWCTAPSPAAGSLAASLSVRADPPAGLCCGNIPFVRGPGSAAGVREQGLSSGAGTLAVTFLMYYCHRGVRCRGGREACSWCGRGDCAVGSDNAECVITCSCTCPPAALVATCSACCRQQERFAAAKHNNRPRAASHPQFTAGVSEGPPSRGTTVCPWELHHLQRPRRACAH